MNDLERTIRRIEERNEKVEADKAEEGRGSALLLIFKCLNI